MTEKLTPLGFLDLQRIIKVMEALTWDDPRSEDLHTFVTQHKGQPRFYREWVPEWLAEEAGLSGYRRTGWQGE